ncbi:DUF1684 domain-containing protein, partial [Austwickia sp. TVS 96-490-7B]|uniref:DUF1684 domain-containing protein n=1 Tax=Austwickia sp. TVS 96-490-7B TaxID=2830843 RepID=UPI001C57900F
VVVGEFVSSGVVESVGWDFSRVEDSRHAKRVPGVLVVVLGGVRYELLTFVDHGALVVVFADATTGVESHAPGRFLRLEGVVGSGPVVVDFNRAFIPPCGFSDFFNCPLPPAQNRLGVAVRGGERHVVWLGEGGLGSVVGGV